MTSTSPSEERPRELIFDWVLDRITILEGFARRNCRSTTCGQKDEDGEFIPCGGEGCGEKRMIDEHQRELQAMRATRALVEWLERDELEKKARDDKQNKGRR